MFVSTLLARAPLVVRPKEHRCHWDPPRPGPDLQPFAFADTQFGGFGSRRRFYGTKPPEHGRPRQGEGTPANIHTSRPKWEAESTGASHGLGNTTTKWGVEFCCIFDDSSGPYLGHIFQNDLTQATEAELRLAEQDTAIAEEIADTRACRMGHDGRGDGR